MRSIYVFPVIDLCYIQKISHCQSCTGGMLYACFMRWLPPAKVFYSLMNQSPIFVLKFGICLLVLLFKTPASISQITYTYKKKKNQLTTQIIRLLIVLICLHGKEMLEGENLRLYAFTAKYIIGQCMDSQKVALMD